MARGGAAQRLARLPGVPYVGAMSSPSPSLQLALLLGLLLPQSPAPTELPALAPAIEAATLAAHVHHLAADERAGRDTASPEILEVAHYLARVLEAQGCEPAGDGGFLQVVPMQRLVVPAAPELVWYDSAGTAHLARAGVDFDVQDGRGSVERAVLSILERGAAPAPLAEGSVAALFVDGRGELRRLAEEHPAALARRALIVVPGSSRPGEPWSGPELGRLQRRSSEPPEGTPTVRVRGEFAQRVRSGEVHALSLVQHAQLESLRCHNVVARIQGVGTSERPELAREVVVLSAHFDHIGIDEAARGKALSSEPPGAGDFVFNGADDDASGVAAVLEIAHALVAQGPPARTVVVLLATGEERGLLGTYHHLEHPAEPLERTVANLNFEMLGRPDPKLEGPGRLWLTGPERTNLMGRLREAGLPIVEDPRPEQGFFFRSDNIAFANIGIVAQTLSSYGMHTDYHRVSDRPETLDYGHMEGAVRAALEAVRLVTDGHLDPLWLPGGKPERR